MDKISIIIPVYNVESFLDRCLESVVGQTYKSIEVIAVDDGSTDSSGDILDSWGEKDPRIKVIHKENGGLSSARNAALDVATGDYIAMIDSDDFWDEDALEHLMTMAKNNDADMVVARGRKVDLEGHIFQHKEKDIAIHEEGMISVDEFYRRIPYDMFFIVAWSKLYRRDVFDDIRFRLGIINEDVEILCDVVKKCKKIYSSDKEIYNWRINPRSITSQPFSAKNLILPRVLLKNVEYLKNSGATEGTLFAFSKYSYSATVDVLSKGYKYLKDVDSKKELKNIYNAYKPIAAFIEKNAGLGNEFIPWVRLLMFNFCRFPSFYFMCRRVFKGI